jgi:hypothetical protein
MEDGAEESADEKDLRPGQCSSYLRTKLAKEFKSIVRGFVKEARNGGCAHMKLAAELLEEAKSSGSRQKGSVQRLLEKLEKEPTEDAGSALAAND